VNALADPRVVEYFNETFVCTYLKVGTFQIINGNKVGGNVASYFCLHDGAVVHAVPGQTNASKLIEEARWAYETRKSALTVGTILGTSDVDAKKFSERIRKAHMERYYAEVNAWHGAQQTPLPKYLPRHRSQQAQAHWLLGREPLAKLDSVYPVVWTQILNEKLSGLPVEKR
jgi:hypothetical protein